MTKDVKRKTAGDRGNEGDGAPKRPARKTPLEKKGGNNIGVSTGYVKDKSLKTVSPVVSPGSPPPSAQLPSPSEAGRFPMDRAKDNLEKGKWNVNVDSDFKSVGKPPVSRKNQQLARRPSEIKRDTKGVAAVKGVGGSEELQEMKVVSSEQLTRQPSMLLKTSPRTIALGRDISTAYTENIERRRVRRNIIACAACLILCVLCMIVLGALAILLLMSQKLEATVVSCITRECLSLSTALTGLLDRDAYPCNDFYGHVCRSWTRRGRSSFLDDAVGMFYDTLAAALNRTSDRPQQNGIHVFFQLYSACTMFMRNNATDSFKDIVRTVSSAVNVSALVDAPDFRTVFQELFRLSFDSGIRSIFSVGFLRIEKRRYLHFSIGQTIGGKLRDLFEQVPLSYPGSADYITDVVSVLLNGNATEDMAREVIEQERRWDNDMGEKARDVESTHVAFNKLSSELSRYSVDDFLDLINRVSPPYLYQTEYSDVYVTGPGLIGKVFFDMYKMNATVRAMHSSVNVLTDVLQYVLLRDFLTEPQSSTAVCIRVAQRSLFYNGPYLTSVLSGYAEGTSQVSEMAEKLIEAFAQSKALHWMGANTVFDIKTVLDRTMMRAYDNDVLFYMSMGVDYTTFSLDDTDFLSSYLTLRRFETRVMRRKLPTDVTGLIRRHQFVPYPAAVTRLRMILIPTILHGPPVFYVFDDRGIPIYFSLGTLGVQIGKEIVELVRNLLDWTPESQWRYGQVKSCILEMRSFINLSSDGDPDTWSQSAFDLSYGARIAFETLRTIIEQAAVPPSVSEEALRVFFVRSCMISCASNSTSSPLIARERCLMATITNPAFYETFRCIKNIRFSVPSCVSTMFTETSTM
ncbi:uncharacterized protein LOC135401431 [Ornithodoros turicata]|uniref:uncharacterized protein LOC135401431 n=1 Tax=Ornithodoros turicata TaxID=34597 RepID=UPI00313938DE